jgi:hypothetical protein
MLEKLAAAINIPYSSGYAGNTDNWDGHEAVEHQVVYMVQKDENSGLDGRRHQSSMPKFLDDVVDA